MTQTKKTKVLFVQEKILNSVLAVFPELIEREVWVQCYSRIGQHSTALISYYKELKEATPAAYMALYDELVNEHGDLEVLNKPQNEPIKCAFTSPTTEGRTIIVYHDGGVKAFDQGDSWDAHAEVKYIEAEELEGELQALLDKGEFSEQEINEIQQAIKAP